MMSRPEPALNVPLMAKKVPALLGYLNYQCVEFTNRQKRLTGRYALRPVVDLGRFKTRAVIDWLTIAVLLERSTQFQWIQSEISGLLGRTPFVANRLGKSNDSSVGFDVRVGLEK